MAAAVCGNPSSTILAFVPSWELADGCQRGLWSGKHRRQMHSVTFLSVIVRKVLQVFSPTFNSRNKYSRFTFKAAVKCRM